MKRFFDSDRLILLPGDPDFDFTLVTSIPPGWRDVADSIGAQCAFIAAPGSGLLRPATDEELGEYLYGGEYEERLSEIEVPYVMG